MCCLPHLQYPGSARASRYYTRLSHSTCSRLWSQGVDPEPPLTRP